MRASADEAPPEYLTLASETLRGDLRDFVLDRLKHDHNPLPWNLRPENEQRDTIDSVNRAIATWVWRACVLIASAGQQVAKGTLVKLASKDGIQMQVNVAASDPLRHTLMDHVGSTVLIVIADPEEHMGQRGEVKINKDQPDMLEDEGEAEAA